MRFAGILFLLFFFALLWAPLGAMISPSLSAVASGRLGGVEDKTTKPQLSVSGLLDGTFQESFDSWFSKKIGLRSVLVRTDNQINFSMFHHSSGHVVVGKDNYLFEKYYIDDLNNANPFPPEKLQEFVDKLALLQQKLHERKTEFMVLIAPSKAYLYPEKIPEKFLLAKSDADNYAQFEAMLRAKNVPYVDGVKTLRELKPLSTYPVFPPGGAHWSSYAACQVGEQVTAEFSALLKRATPQLVCDPPYVRPTSHGLDRDLWLLANLWTTASLEVPMQYPKASTIYPPNAYRPNVLFVGDSFMWAMFHYLEKQRVYESRDFFFYYKSHYRFHVNRKAMNKQPLNPDTLDWNKVLSHDLVVLEFNQARIPDVGFGFVEDALAHLDQLTVRADAPRPPIENK